MPKAKYTGVDADTSLTRLEPQVWCVSDALLARIMSRIAAYCRKFSLARIPTARR
ncbi:hypothetical protein D3C78_1576950 [compost metagenome]